MDNLRDRDNTRDGETWYKSQVADKRQDNKHEMMGVGKRGRSCGGGDVGGYLI